MPDSPIHQTFQFCQNHQFCHNHQVHWIHQSHHIMQDQQNIYQFNQNNQFIPKSTVFPDSLIWPNLPGSSKSLYLPESLEKNHPNQQNNQFRQFHHNHQNIDIFIRLSSIASSYILKVKKVCGVCFSVSKHLEKCVNLDDNILW